MPTIKFGGGASNSATNAIRNMTSSYGPLSGDGAIGGAGPVSVPVWYSNKSRVNIYKGTIADFSTFTTISSRSSDLLISFTPTTTNPTVTGNVTINGITYYRYTLAAPSSTTASASGTAAWFLAYNSDRSSNLLYTSGMMGTVGGPGSGADLEIASTTIVSGQTYVCGTFTFSFPLVWNL